MNIFKKQQQNVEGGSTALQAQRDIIQNHYHGMRDQEVTDLVTKLLDKNFPTLLDVAMKQVHENIALFNDKLHKVLGERFNNLDFDKLSDPDVQADFNEASNSAARKGNKSNLELLADVLSNRLQNDASNILDNVASEAIRVIPKLSNNQLSFISLVFIMKNVKFNHPKTIGGFDEVFTLFDRFFVGAFTISKSEMQILNTYGVLTTQPIFNDDVDPFELYQHTYSDFLGNTKEPLSERFKNEAPNTYWLARKFADLGAIKYEPTPVGQLIAHQFLTRNSQLTFDIKIWIN